jgi:hypothetical protein
MSATYPVYLLGIQIRTGVNDTIVFDEGGGNLTATIAPGLYYLKTDGAADDLSKAITDALTAAGDTYSAIQVNYQDPTQQSTIRFLVASGTFKLVLASSTFPLQVYLGMTPANETLSSGQTGANGTAIVWVSNQPLAGQEVSRVSDISQHITAQGQVHTYVGQDALATRLLEHELVAALKTKGDHRSFENWWALARQGFPFQYHSKAQSAGLVNSLDSTTLVDTLVLGEDACRSFAPARLSRGLALYSWAIECRRYVA